MRFPDDLGQCVPSSVPHTLLRLSHSLRIFFLLAYYRTDSLPKMLFHRVLRYRQKLLPRLHRSYRILRWNFLQSSLPAQPVQLRWYLKMPLLEIQAKIHLTDLQPNGSCLSHDVKMQSLPDLLEFRSHCQLPWSMSFRRLWSPQSLHRSSFDLVIVSSP